MKSSIWQSLIVGALMAFAGYAALFIAPDEKTMHAIQRIFYFHAPAGMVALIAFNSVVLITGPIWAKPAWGIWWAWDARLTSTLVLWLLYISFLLLRSLMPDPNRRAVFSAIYGIFLFLDVPLVYFSIRIWRTQHPQPVILGGQNSGLDPTMRKVFWLCWLALMGNMVFLIRQRNKLGRARHEFEELRIKAEEQSADARESAPRAIRV